MRRSAFEQMASVLAELPRSWREEEPELTYPQRHYREHRARRKRESIDWYHANRVEIRRRRKEKAARDREFFIWLRYPASKGKQRSGFAGAAARWGKRDGITSKPKGAEGTPSTSVRSNRSIPSRLHPWR